MAISEQLPSPRKRRGRKPAQKRKAKAALAELEPLDVLLPPDTSFDPIMTASGAMEMPQPDGSLIFDFAPEQSHPQTTNHLDNLAMQLSDLENGRIANELHEGIESDDQGRQPWLNDRAKGIDLLGLKLEEPKSGAGSSSAPLEGMSVVRHPLLLEAVLRGHANALGEFLPSAGPVKVKNDGAQTSQADDLSETLERDFNHYLTTTASEYYPDTDRMLMLTYFGGTMAKKVYTCPIRRRPVSESVDPKDLIFSNTATDLKNASRVTHRITMRRSVMKRMQLLGVYRNVPLNNPSPEPNAVDQKIARQQGTEVTPQRPDDQDYVIDECYCELDIAGFEHREDGEITGLPLPYRVTIERNSRQVLEIRRNWAEDDQQYTAKMPFVIYTFVPGFGLYGIGLLHILGNTTSAVTAAWREMLDAGMFANFPGLLRAKTSGRQTDNQIRVPPGGCAEIDTGSLPIQQAVMALPYKEPGPATMALVDNIAQTGQRLGGSAEVSIGEGKQDAPVGTTLALIEQATKIMSAVHKRLHSAQSEEFRLLLDEFRADPEALWRHNKKAAKFWDVPRFLAALENIALVPVADPNTPSHMHRLMKAMALKQLSMGNPLYNQKEVDSYIMQEAGIGDPERFFLPPQPPAPPPLDPIKVAETQLKGQELELRKADAGMKYVDKHADRKNKRDIAVLNLARELAIHPESDPVVDEQLQQMTPMLGVPIIRAPARPMMPMRQMRPPARPMPMVPPLAMMRMAPRMGLGP